MLISMPCWNQSTGRSDVDLDALLEPVDGSQRRIRQLGKVKALGEECVCGRVENGNGDQDGDLHSQEENNGHSCNYGRAANDKPGGIRSQRCEFGIKLVGLEVSASLLALLESVASA